jgi:hypothetical protein
MTSGSSIPGNAKQLSQEQVARQRAIMPALSRSTLQIAGRDAIDIGQPPVRAGAEIQTCYQIEQAMIGAVGDRNRQGLFIKGFDIATDDTAQHPAQRALLGVALTQGFKFLLEGAEGPQAVVLLGKPRIQLIHVSLFKQEKKLPVYTSA